MTSLRENALVGSLLGTAVADALGLPMEGLSKTRQRKMFPEVKGYRFLFGKGMVSDDTEHTCLVAQSIIASGENARVFAEELSWRMRRWLLGLPAGVGFATLRAILKLFVGFPVEKSGVFSAGNGPAMRSPIIGVCFGESKARLKELVTISTRITHTDPKAAYGALAVALAAFCASRHEEDPPNYLNALQDLLGPEGEELLALAKMAMDSASRGGVPPKTLPPTWDSTEASPATSTTRFPWRFTSGSATRPIFNRHSLRLFSVVATRIPWRPLLGVSSVQQSGKRVSLPG